MDPLTTTNYYAMVVGFVVSITLSLVAVYPQIKRLRSQNKKDDMDALEAAVKLVGMDVQKQLKLQEEVDAMRAELRSVQNRKFRITIVFSLGENPRVDESTIELIEVTP